jgi:hypothetical protein
MPEIHGCADDAKAHARNAWLLDSSKKLAAEQARCLLPPRSAPAMLAQSGVLLPVSDHRRTLDSAAADRSVYLRPDAISANALLHTAESSAAAFEWTRRCRRGSRTLRRAARRWTAPCSRPS